MTNKKEKLSNQRASRVIICNMWNDNIITDKNNKICHYVSNLHIFIFIYSKFWLLINKQYHIFQNDVY